jgi:hypothetical protein
MPHLVENAPPTAGHAVIAISSAFRHAWSEHLVGRSDDYDDLCEPLVRALALIPARTTEALAAKAHVTRLRLLGQSMAETIADGAESDTALLLSFAADALAMS